MKSKSERRISGKVKGITEKNKPFEMEQETEHIEQLKQSIGELQRRLSKQRFSFDTDLDEYCLDVDKYLQGNETMVDTATNVFYTPKSKTTKRSETVKEETNGDPRRTLSNNGVKGKRQMAHDCMIEKEMELERDLSIEEQAMRNLRKKEQILVQSIRKQEEESCWLKEKITLLEQRHLYVDKKRKERIEMEKRVKQYEYMEKQRNDELHLLRDRKQTLEAELMQDEGSIDEGNTCVNRHLGMNQSYGKPVIPAFHGTDVDIWKMDIESLMKGAIFPDEVLAQSVRNSLKGQTRRILLTLKTPASTKEIVDKVEEIYGKTEKDDKILEEFYSASQLEKESVSEWGIRIESMWQEAVKKGEVEDVKRDQKLKTRFWKGLRNEKIKEATRISYESKDTFEKLRSKSRIEEEEVERFQKRGVKAKSNMITEDWNRMNVK